MHLWESDHPYCFNEGNYYSNDGHTEWPALENFLAEYGDADIDMNLIVRWDWHEGEDHGLAPYNGSDTDRIGELKMQMVHQRKARLASHSIKVCRNDEEAVKDFLAKHASTVAQNWTPILVSR